MHIRKTLTPAPKKQDAAGAYLYVDPSTDEVSYKDADGTRQSFLLKSGGTITGAITATGAITGASLTTTGAISGDDLTVTGVVIENATTASSSDAAIPITGRIHEITAEDTGDALTLVDGAEGQRLTVVYVAESAGGDTAVLTPSNLAGGTTITFADVGDSAELVFTASTWFMVGGSATLA